MDVNTIPNGKVALLKNDAGLAADRPVGIVFFVEGEDQPRIATHMTLAEFLHFVAGAAALAANLVDDAKKTIAESEGKEATQAPGVA